MVGLTPPGAPGSPGERGLNKKPPRCNPGGPKGVDSLAFSRSPSNGALGPQPAWTRPPVPSSGPKAPARNPRTECACQPVAFRSSFSEAPPERLSRPRTLAVLVPGRATVAFLGDLADVALVLAFFAGLALWPDLARIGATWARCAATRGLRVGFGSLTSSPEQRWASSQEQGGSAPERKDGPQRRRSGFERIRAGGEVGAGRSRRWSSERQAGHGGWQRSWNSLPLRARGAVRFWRCAGRIFGNGKSELRFLRSSETASAGVAS